ncbi:MAG: amylo-alpha-1,6-glucosidase [Actinomycetota bacterium]|nr:amylo-alpha-1,6-glucosidase [Actinomycetota bacterium]
MSNPWTTAETPLLQPALLRQPSGMVTLLEGWTFCISERSGDVLSGLPEGLFFRDLRFLSSLRLHINGAMPQPLGAQLLNPFSAVFVSHLRPAPGRADSTLVIFRSRFIGRGMREDIVLTNFGDEAQSCEVAMTAAADFATIFDVKEGRVRSTPEDGVFHAGADFATITADDGANRYGVRISSSQVAEVDESGRMFRFHPTIGPREEWRVCFEFSALADETTIEPRYRCGQPVEEAVPAQRHRAWRSQVPVIESDHEEFRQSLVRGAEQLGALRMSDPDYPDRTIVAAGAPWFMTLFGRDSLLTAWMALIVDPSLALGVLQTLARFQGRAVNPATDEEPGRILHEIRFAESADLSLEGGTVYYGSIDATPLFVMLLGELRRWGLERQAVEELAPNVDRAMGWIEEYGDRDGDGYVEYMRAGERGLANQGWKDSWDAIRFADGRLPRGPVALCEVQGYVYSAYLARSYFAEEVGDMEVAGRYRAKAQSLKAAFNRDYWLEDRGWFALGLDGDKRPIDALASNMGHCLWTGIVDESKAPQVAAHLLSDDMFTGWGIRTLAASMTSYNPFSYHAGSVWPHDNAIIASGLMRYGFVDEAHRVIMAMVDAASAGGGVLPELFAGLDRGPLPAPIDYPTSCSPQAWAAASPFLFLRTLLRLDPWVPHGQIWLAPTLPEQITSLHVEGIPLANERMRVTINGQVAIDGLPSSVQIVKEPRRPGTAG